MPGTPAVAKLKRQLTAWTVGSGGLGVLLLVAAATASEGSTTRVVMIVFGVLALVFAGAFVLMRYRLSYLERRAAPGR